MGDPRVVVVGGGYAGATIATALDAVADVTLVEPKDSFVHATGALRAAVDATWEDRVFFPYDRLLARGRVVHEYAQAVTSRQVRVSAGRVIDADYLVLATGTAYPFPAKFIESDVLVAKARLARLREALRAARSALIVGAGPVGLELAGEIASAFPAIDLVIVDQAEDALTTGDYLPELRSAIRSQLEARGVSFALGSPLGYLPPVDVGVLAPFTVHTRAGRRIDADLWFRCYGNQPVTDYLVGDLAAARLPDGSVAVGSTLNVRGFPTVFAIGDISAEHGGQITEHHSHQSGRDVDIGLIYKHKPVGFPASFIPATEDNLDCEATYALLAGFAATHDEPGGAQVIFLDYDLQRLLYDWAKEHDVDPDVLDRTFQYPHGRGSSAGLVHHEPNHDNHMHVRFKCPRGDSACR